MEIKEHLAQIARPFLSLQSLAQALFFYVDILKRVCYTEIVIIKRKEAMNKTQGTVNGRKIVIEVNLYDYERREYRYYWSITIDDDERDGGFSRFKRNAIKAAKKAVKKKLRKSTPVYRKEYYGKI